MRICQLLFVLLIFFLDLCGQDNNTLLDSQIKIEFSCDSTTFPSFWFNNEINAKGKSLDSSEIERSKRVILKALSKYPNELILKNITKIFVLKEMQFFGQPYGGTTSTSVIYLSNDGIQNGYSDFWLEQKFHSEFSSILFRNYSHKFKNRKWVSFNSPEIKYGTSGVDAIRNGKASLTFDLDLNKKGFLFLYATSTIEEDFNSFAENLFLSRDSFWEIVNKNERIKMKMLLVVEFYSKIDKSFSYEYFEKISKN